MEDIHKNLLFCSTKMIVYMQFVKAIEKSKEGIENKQVEG